jgi:hypothetical protein
MSSIFVISDVDTKYANRFIRKRALKVIKEILDGQVIRYGWDESNNDEGSGVILTARNRIIDGNNLNPKHLPLLSILPAPHTITVGLLGTMRDSTYRIAIQGFVARRSNSEELIDAAEDVIEVITNLLTLEENVQKMFSAYFSIVEMGPILDEQYDVDGNIAYISIPLAVQFVE